MGKKSRRAQSSSNKGNANRWQHQCRQRLNAKILKCSAEDNARQNKQLIGPAAIPSRARCLCACATCFKPFRWRQDSQNTHAMLHQP